MSFVGTYLNFPMNSEEAIGFYRSIFNPNAKISIYRFSELPMADQLTENECNAIMHAELEIIGGHKIFVSDFLPSSGQQVRIGNNTTISLTLDSREEADHLYSQLSVGATENIAPHQEPWGYWGICLDRFGVRWMFHVPESN